MILDIEKCVSEHLYGAKFQQLDTYFKEKVLKHDETNSWGRQPLPRREMIDVYFDAQTARNLALIHYTGTGVRSFDVIKSAFKTSASARKMHLIEWTRATPKTQTCELVFKELYKYARFQEKNLGLSNLVIKPIFKQREAAVVQRAIENSVNIHQ